MKVKKANIEISLGKEAYNIIKKQTGRDPESIDYADYNMIAHNSGTNMNILGINRRLQYMAIPILYLTEERGMYFIIFCYRGDNGELIGHVEESIISYKVFLGLKEKYKEVRGNKALVALANIDNAYIVTGSEGVGDTLGEALLARIKYANHDERVVIEEVLSEWVHFNDKIDSIKMVES